MICRGAQLNPDFWRLRTGGQTQVFLEVRADLKNRSFSGLYLWTPPALCLRIQKCCKQNKCIVQSSKSLSPPLFGTKSVLNAFQSFIIISTCEVRACKLTFSCHVSRCLDHPVWWRFFYQKVDKRVGGRLNNVRKNTFWCGMTSLLNVIIKLWFCEYFSRGSFELETTPSSGSLPAEKYLIFFQSSQLAYFRKVYDVFNSLALSVSYLWIMFDKLSYLA